MKAILKKQSVIHRQPVLGRHKDFSPEEWRLILAIRAGDLRAAKAWLSKLDKSV